MSLLLFFALALLVVAGGYLIVVAAGAAILLPILTLEAIGRMPLRNVVGMAIIGIICLLVFTDTVTGTAGWVLFGVAACVALATMLSPRR